MEEIIGDLRKLLPPALGMVEFIEMVPGNSDWGSPFGGYCTPKGGDIHCELSLTLEEYFKGGSFEISFEREYTDHNDRREQDFGSQIGPITIEKKAYLPVKKIKSCTQKLNLGPFPALTSVFPNEGNGQNGRPGDLIVNLIIEERSDSPFKIKRTKAVLNLYLSLELTLEESLLGFDKSVLHPSGENLELTCCNSILSSRKLVIPERGVDGRDLRIVFSVKKEDLLFTPHQREDLFSFFQAPKTLPFNDASIQPKPEKGPSDLSLTESVSSTSHPKNSVRAQSLDEKGESVLAPIPHPPKEDETSASIPPAVALPPAAPFLVCNT